MIYGHACLSLSLSEKYLKSTGDFPYLQRDTDNAVIHKIETKARNIVYGKETWLLPPGQGGKRL